MNYLKKIKFNPFIMGILIGLLVDNMPLALVAAGLTMMLWGDRKGKNHIIATVIILVIVTGNINFEISYIFVLSLVWTADMIIKNSKSKGIIFFIIGFFILTLFPFWKYVMGSIPAQLLNEINIAGELLLLAGILLNLQRGLKTKRNRVKFLIYTLSAGMCVTAKNFVVFILLGGFLFEHLMTLDGISEKVYNILLVAFSFVFIVYYLPLNIFVIMSITVLFFYIYLRWEKSVVIETIYLSFLMGLAAGRMGLIN